MNSTVELHDYRKHKVISSTWAAPRSRKYQPEARASVFERNLFTRLRFGLVPTRTPLTDRLGHRIQSSVVAILDTATDIDVTKRDVRLFINTRVSGARAMDLLPPISAETRVFDDTTGELLYESQIRSFPAQIEE